MLAIKTSKENWETHGGFLIGQLGESVIIEVEEAPNYTHEDITNVGIRFDQRVFDGKYEETVTYAELCKIRSLIEKYGEANSLIELVINSESANEEQIAELQDAIAEMIGGA